MRQCYVCSTPVERKGATGRMPKYCGEDCRNAAKRAVRAAERRAYYDALYGAQLRAFRDKMLGEAA